MMMWVTEMSHSVFAFVRSLVSSFYLGTVDFVLMVVPREMIMSSTKRREIDAAAGAGATGGLRGVIAGKSRLLFQASEKEFVSCF